MKDKWYNTEFGFILAAGILIFLTLSGFALVIKAAKYEKVPTPIEQKQ
jgi:hypothetical protein